MVPRLPLLRSGHRSGLVVAFLAAAACTGPAVHIDNPVGHTVFVDGVATTAATLPFRYYGTMRWDALPADKGGRADFTALPASAEVPLPPPAPLWLFPLDFPLELVDRLLHGRPDTTVVVTLPRAPVEQREGELLHTEARAQLQRALQARVAR